MKRLEAQSSGIPSNPNVQIVRALSSTFLIQMPRVFDEFLYSLVDVHDVLRVCTYDQAPISSFYG